MTLLFHLQTLAVLNPFRQTDQSILQDTDMAGPLAFCLALGGFLLLVSIAKVIYEGYEWVVVGWF